MLVAYVKIYCCSSGRRCSNWNRVGTFNLTKELNLLPRRSALFFSLIFNSRWTKSMNNMIPYHVRVINYYKTYMLGSSAYIGFPNAVLRFLSKNFIDTFHANLKFSLLKVTTYNNKDSGELKR